MSTAINRAVESCNTQGINVDDHYRDLAKMVYINSPGSSLGLRLGYRFRYRPRETFSPRYKDFANHFLQGNGVPQLPDVID